MIFELLKRPNSKKEIERLKEEVAVLTAEKNSRVACEDYLILYKQHLEAEKLIVDLEIKILRLGITLKQYEKKFRKLKENLNQTIGLSLWIGDDE